MRYCKMMMFTLVMALAAFAADSPFTGKWQLDAAKSKFIPGPPPKSETVTIAPDGKVTVEETSAVDKPMSWSYTMVEGQEAPITGMGDNSSVVEKRIGRTVTHVWKMSGHPATGKGVVSKNGKTMTYRIHGTGADGKP
ncbi:MAG: hypothetical protein M3Y07_17770, partial [Acidobacteriota bacterium]|nr:hypothetical protein [Acidobacteriota bacterium]